MKTFDELLSLYEGAAAPTRQRVLDLLPTMSPPTDEPGSRLALELWDRALRAVFETSSDELQGGRWVTRLKVLTSGRGYPAIEPETSGLFRDHSCWKCRDGEKACVAGNPRQCEYPHARND